MKRTILAVVILLIVAGMIYAGRRTVPVTANSVQEVMNGQNTPRVWNVTDVIYGSADACTTDWMQIGASLNSFSADSNKYVTQVGANYFVAFVKMAEYGAGDSAMIDTAYYQLSTAYNGDIYYPADGSEYFIDATVSSVGGDTTAGFINRAYPVYVPGGLFMRMIFVPTAIADTMIFTLTLEGHKN